MNAKRLGLIFAIVALAALLTLVFAGRQVLAGVAKFRVSAAVATVCVIGTAALSLLMVSAEDDLTATALVLDDGITRVGIVALDMLAINEFVVDRVRGRSGHC